jgi:signal transduction histidine kinase
MRLALEQHSDKEFVFLPFAPRASVARAHSRIRQERRTRLEVGRPSVTYSACPLHAQLRETGRASGSAGIEDRQESGPASRAVHQSPSADPRREFVAMVAHELRNTLNAIQLAISLLHGDQAKRLQPDWMLGGLENSIGQMVRLTDDLMNVCKATHPTFELSLGPLNIAAAVDTWVEQRRPDFEQKGLWLVFQPQPRPAWIMADAERLELVLSNLLDNASKYTARDGMVIVSVSIEQTEAVLRIQDTGVGIASETLQHVFEPFVREMDSSRQSIPGSGIGLLLVRTLVQLHGGQVNASSYGRGHGSTFLVRIPLMSGNPPEAGQPPVTAPS